MAAPCLGRTAPTLRRRRCITQHEPRGLISEWSRRHLAHADAPQLIRRRWTDPLRGCGGLDKSCPQDSFEARLTRHCLCTTALVLLISCGRGGPTPPSPQPPPSSPRYAVSGTVRDSGNLNLLEAVSVRLTDDSGAREVTTGFDGQFSFSEVSGSATLTASAAGYEASPLAIAGAASMLDVRLRRIVGRSVVCGQAPDTGNRVLPLFSRPFDGNFTLTNYFDHDLPTGTYAGNGYQLTFCDERIGGRLDTHQGYDWLLPLGTPVLAVKEGEVINAGYDPPFFCATLGR
ncbi:MAG: carboxypeptidase regulatory-like domain-containing protein, partial [Bryobacterales bacterium]|nr:carboxypeptidase regulatory-like domain-containing protein [Bryobacterales bacterium]